MKMRLKRRRKEIGEGKEETETRIRRLRLLWVFVDKVAAAEVTQRPRDRLILLTKSLSTLTSSTPRLFTTPCRPVSPFLFHLFTSASPHTVFMPSPPPLFLFALSLCLRVISSFLLLSILSASFLSLLPVSPPGAISYHFFTSVVLPLPLIPFSRHPVQPPHPIHPYLPPPLSLLILSRTFLPLLPLLPPFHR